MNDLRFALRQLRNSPGFTFSAVLTLALGIGANTAIFSVINAVLLRPLPYPHADRIISLKEAGGGSEFFLSLPDYLDWRRDNTVFSHLAISRIRQQSLSALPGRDPEQVTSGMVTANFFQTIGVPAARGRTFTEEEDKPGAPPLVVISDRLWQRAFQRDPAIIGRAITIDGGLRTVIGVMPPDMSTPGDSDLWISLMRNAEAWQNRGIHPLLLGWGRLKDGVSLEQARAEMKTIAARIAKEHPDTNDGTTAALTPLLDMIVGSYRQNLELLLGAVALVLLIACVNVANLFASRIAARERDFAIRIAIGANRAQIIRQVLLESLLIAVIGGAAGLLIAVWSRDLLIALSPPSISRFKEVTFDAPVLTFTFALTTLSSVLAGVWPAWQSSRADVSLALKAGAHGSSDTRATRRTRDWFVITEIALTLVLLSSAALVLKSFARVQSVSLGYDPHELLSARLNLPFKSYNDQGKVVTFGRALMDKMRALPGVENVALSSNPPLLSGWQIGFFHAEAGMSVPSSQQFNAESEVVSGDYFKTMKVSLVRGRTLDERDAKDAPLVVLIDQALADQYFPNENPIGRRLACDPDGDGNQNRAFEIVGVVAPMKFYGAQQALTFPVLYFSLQQVNRQQLVVLVRGRANAKSLERPLREAVSSIDPSLPIFDVRTMNERVSETWGTQRLLSFLLGVFAAVALALATIGLYGVIAFTTLRRLREIGVRLALGAQRSDIRTLILQHGLRLLSFGLAIGLVGALACSRLLGSVLFNVPTFDIPTYLIVCLVLAVATFLASWLPSLRAARVNPISVLRAD